MIEKRLRRELSILESQISFMAGRATIEVTNLMGRHTIGYQEKCFRVAWRRKRSHLTTFRWLKI